MSDPDLHDAVIRLRQDGSLAQARKARIAVVWVDDLRLLLAAFTTLQKAAESTQDGRR
jgi:hypothetical protein